MSNCNFVFSLPFLHKELGCDGDEPMILLDSIKYVWPGLPHMPENFYWSAPDYTFDFVNAKHCMKNLDAMGEMAMTGVPVHSLIAMDLDVKDRKERRELNDLKSFAHSGLHKVSKSNVDNAAILVSAQKMLLWVWLLEEKALEMRSLMHNYKKRATVTIDPLVVDEQSSMNTLLNMEYQLEEGDEPLPSWEIVLENAAVFLPNESIIFVSCKQMVDELQEKLNFQKCTETILKICGENLTNKYDIMQSESFVYEALGKKRAVHKHLGLDKLFTFVILRGF